MRGKLLLATLLGATLSVGLVRPVAAEPQWAPIAFELGAVELGAGDTLTITEVAGDRPAFEAGGTYRVRGRYRLASQDRAKLLFSLTLDEHRRQKALPASQRLVTRGDGTFELTKTFDGHGHPHVSFYATSGQVAGCVYFGRGEWTLAHKSWTCLR